MSDESEPVTGPGLLLALDRAAGPTLHEQLERWLRDQVRVGKLAPGDRLPSSRALAAELNVSRGVVLEAYAQLSAEGYLTASQGAPTRVAGTFSLERPPVPASSLEPHYRHDFQPGVPDLQAFPRASWMRRCERRCGSRHSMPSGRGIRAAPGAAQRADALPRTGEERRAGARAHARMHRVHAGVRDPVPRAPQTAELERIAVEQPGWAQHRLIAERAGLEAVPVAVDEDGLDVDQLRATGCEVVVTTPAHQFPTGGVMASERRSALLEWAEDEDALIIEDDYDSELRYDRVPVGALQGLAPERVCHIGSASKRLAPGVRLGWLLSPSWLTGALTYEKALADGGAPAVEQLALADFIARGELERHLRRMRLRYRARREALVDALGRVAPGAACAASPPDSICSSCSTRRSTSRPC